MRILNKIGGGGGASQSRLSGGPFTAAIQIRFKKPANTAQTRLETRTLDSKLDRLASRHRRLLLILSLYHLVAAKKRGPFVSVNLLSRWAPHAGDLLRKYPHVFEVFAHPLRRNACCKFTPNFVELLKLEDEILINLEDANVIKIRKILAMSENGRIHIHAIRLMRRELGLPENFRDSIIRKHSEMFRMVDLEVVELVDWDGREREGAASFTAEVEKWREREYREKWLSEFETKYAFPIHFPTGFKIVAGFKEKLNNWQRLSYMKPYERPECIRVRVRVRTCGGVERYEKRAVGIIHELLSLTEEKMMELERLAHFRKDLGIMVNVRELLLKHPGIFYVATKGKYQIVFLREAYKGDCLVEANAVYDVRRKMLELLLLGCRNTRQLKDQDEEATDVDVDVDVAEDEEREVVPQDENMTPPAKDGDFVIPILQSFFK